MKNWLKNQKGSMAVYAIVTVFVIITVLVGVFLGTASVRKNQLKTMTKIKEAYERALEDKQEIYEEKKEKIEKAKEYMLTIQYRLLREANSKLAEDTVEKVKNKTTYVASNFAIEINGYVYSEASKSEITIDGKDETLILYYDVDVIGNNGGSDGIPDKYQAVVSYNVVNGTIEPDGGASKAVVYTLYDSEGKPSEDGEATIMEEDIPELTPIAGYGAGAWRPGDPVGAKIRIGGATFICTYSVIVNPGPNPGPGPVIPEPPVPVS